jgi:hypothetical protein
MYAREIAGKSPEAIRAIKRMLNRLSVDPGPALLAESVDTDAREMVDHDVHRKARQDLLQLRHDAQVRVELQADCLAGVWANRAQEKWQFIEPGDVEAAMTTASAIGDDRLQRQSQGYVVPDAFTHGE